MRRCMNEPDWNLLRAFAATVEAGSLSGAGRALGVNPSTISRQIAALEASLAVQLFDRIGKRLVLTEPGHALAAHAAAMRDAADGLLLAATGRSEQIAGPVTVSATDAVALFLLPPILARVRDLAPNLTLRVVVANALSDLRRREADIAIRHVRPVEPELIGRLVGHATARFYASKGWIARNGHPRAPTDAAGATFIGSDEEDRFVSFLRELGIPVGPDQPAVVSEHAAVAWELARHGLGITPIMTEIASRFPDLVPVLDDVPPIRFPIWVVAHHEVRTATRIRLVFDLLADALSRPD